MFFIIILYLEDYKWLLSQNQWVKNDGKKYRLSKSNLSLKTIKVKGRQCRTRGIVFAICPNFGKVEVQSLFVQRKNKSHEGQLLRQIFWGTSRSNKRILNRIFSAEPGNKWLNNPTLIFSYIELCKCLLRSLFFHIIPFPMKSLRCEVPCERYHIFIFLS